MGLDMYLTAKKRMYPNWKEKKEDTQEMKEIRKAVPEMFKSGNMDYMEVGFEAGYWRKANHVHAWFVEKCQDGEDNCGRHYVSRDNLKELLYTVKKVLKSSSLIPDTVINGYKYTQEEGKVPMLENGKVMLNDTVAKKLLPCQSGFFFGGTDYDQYYYESLEETRDILQRCLDLGEDWEFEYQSSW